MNTKSIAQEVFDLTIQIRELEEKLSPLKEDLMAAMQVDGLVKLMSEQGTINLSERKTWRYSRKVAKLAEELKLQKIIEESRKIAKIEKVTSYLTVKGASK